MSRINVTTKINYGGSIGERTISCFEIKPNPEKPPENGEISMGGDSGSVWLIDSEIDSGLVVGLHFAGESDPAPENEHALSCYIKPVLDKLEVTIIPAQQLRSMPVVLYILSCY